MSFEILGIDRLTETKPINYFGLTVNVPLTVKSIAVDKSGAGYGYYDEPTLGNSMWESNHYVCLFKARFNGDWRDSLMVI